MNFVYDLFDNALTARDYIRLRDTQPWRKFSEVQVETALVNSLVTVAAICGDDIIGMGRLTGDGVTIFYIQDVIVLPEFQGQGVGKAIINRLIECVKEIALPGTNISIALFSEKGKEGFYQKFGFNALPNDMRGAAMEIKLTTE